MCVCVCLCTIACVCLCKPRRSLSPGPNLGLYRGDIRFPTPLHMCVSTSTAVLETMGIVCVCLLHQNGEPVCVCVCVMTQSPVGKRVCLGQAEPLNSLFPFPPQKINEGRKPIKTDDGISVIAAIK